ncbi:hypothetical protein POM88_019427 [Heracleum sosnowskyi]|uniref:PAZ domain-containing protein n=1 Tax=Heracleum sosnowskyi TaxID=360622 RepID=A0AAD8MQW2_9APIA|nr:hypothetical protein POM88_019427 [Heracleum sosnowskyi]
MRMGNIRNIPLRYSGDLPCINVGKPKRPTYIPLELCSLVSLQRYTKALTTLQRLSWALKVNNYVDEPLLRACGVLVSNNFTQVEGCVLSAPRVHTLLSDLPILLLVALFYEDGRPVNGKSIGRKVLLNKRTLMIVVFL